MSVLIAPRTSIQQDTRIGNRIPNFQAQWGAANAKALDAGLRADFPKAEHRMGPSPYYNCHGMTFASRRTAIEDYEVIHAILSDDEYDVIPRERVLAGDVIVYYSNEGDPEHSGIVVQPPSEGNFWVPMVCSKWGAFSEFVHPGNHCPYDFSSTRYYRVQR